MSHQHEHAPDPADAARERLERELEKRMRGPGRASGPDPDAEFRRIADQLRANDEVVNVLPISMEPDRRQGDRLYRLFRDTIGRDPLEQLCDVGGMGAVLELGFKAGFAGGWLAQGQTVITALQGNAGVQVDRYQGDPDKVAELLRLAKEHNDARREADRDAAPGQGDAGAPL